MYFVDRFDERFICRAGVTEVKKDVNLEPMEAVERWIEIVNLHFAKSEGVGNTMHQSLPDSPGIYIVQLWRILHAGAVTLCTFT